MKRFINQLTLSALSFVVITGCTATAVTQSTQASANHKAKVNLPLVRPPQAEQALTLNQIMANPDWMGLLAQGAYWSDDSQAVYFSRQASEAAVSTQFRQPISGAALELTLNDLHLADQENGQLNQAQDKKVYLYQGNLFIKNLSSSDIKQLTRQNMAIEGARFLTNDDIAYWQGGSVYRLHQDTGLIEQIAAVVMENEPKSIQEPESYIAKQQHRLIDFVAKEHSKAKDRQTHRQNLSQKDPTFANKTWYLGDSEVVSELSLSPNGRYLLLSLIDKTYDWRGEHDIMPNYLGKEGYIEPVPARSRVAEDNPPGERFVLLDLESHTKKDITIEGLTGFDQDVLAKVSEAKVRKVQLMQDWGWDQSAIQWNAQGTGVLVLLESIDNKDRWLASVNLVKGSLVTEHRLHDDAWINYDYNQFGWLENSDAFYYLSEETGFSQLYVKSH
jgi:hypothetical protein